MIDGPASPGDANPIADVYQQQWSRLLKLGWALSGSREVAEDAVHDAFVALNTHWAEVDEPSAYLRRSVINGLHDRQRRLGTERRFPQPPPAPTFNPEIEEIWEELLTLPERQRHALFLRYYEDRSIGSIAAEMECPAGTVASLIHRGLATLKEGISQ
jgi:RNA polymerase sigma factor (sigma-70 family)